nr:metallophosphoesterase [Micromonospora sp. DSM 115978]
MSDEVVEALWTTEVRRLEPDLVLAAGDLPFAYLEFLVEALDVPVVFVPGNHDPDLGGFRLARSGLVLRDGLPVRAPWPAGAVNADGRCVDAAGLRIAGLGGSVRYRPGPNQYSQAKQTRRARALARRAGRRARRDGRGVDVLLAHSP